MKKLAIIPAYNEEENIERTVQNFVNSPENDFDYIIINDCSTDNTKTICEDNKYNVINLPLNLGIGGAVQTGYLYAYTHNYDIAVQLDGDGQHDPSYLNKMLDYMLQKNADMVIGSRFINRMGFQSSAARRMGIKYFTFLIRILTGVTISDPTSGLRMVNRSIIKLFAANYPKDYPEPESAVAILRQKKKILEMPVVMNERLGGVSSISFTKSIYYMIKVTLAILIERIRA